MALTAAVGTCISLSATLPATHDEAGFAALTFTQVGELEKIGEITRERESIEFKNMCTGRTSTLKGAENGTTIELTVGHDLNDAGQTMLRAAYDDPNSYAFKVTQPDGIVYYWTGKVMKASILLEGTDSVIKGDYSVGVDAPQTGAKIVTVVAP